MSKIPTGEDDLTFAVGKKRVGLTNLGKVFWPADGYTKRDLLQYYLDVSSVLLPHLRERAMVMKRYPNGIDGDFFFMKRTPAKRPDWITTCRITHGSGNVIDFPIIDDAAALLWVINLGCIDLNPWYARCDDYDRPDYLHFDLDPVEGTPFATVREVALAVHDALDGLKMPNYVKTTGSKGMHVYVPIVRGRMRRYRCRSSGPRSKAAWRLPTSRLRTRANASRSAAISGRRCGRWRADDSNCER